MPTCSKFIFYFNFFFSASNFGKSLTELETLQSTIASGVQNNKELLQGVQEVFAHNIDSLQKEIKKLDERISKLATA